jgi:hypothetical protein
MMNWNMLIDKWYFGLFLVGYGLFLVVRAHALNDLRRYFRRDDRSPELDDAVARRQELESLPLAAWYVPGIVNVLLGAAVLGGALSGIIGYGFGMCAFVASLGISYLRLRNRGATRAAALAPRTLTSIVPLPWYPAAALVSVAPLAFVDVPQFGVAAILVTLAAIATFGFAIASSSMASIMPGRNPEVELYVDNRIRRCRVLGLFAIGMGVPLVFVAMAWAATPSTLLNTLAIILVFAAWCGFVIPLLMHRVRVPRFL